MKFFFPNKFTARSSLVYFEKIATIVGK